MYLTSHRPLVWKILRPRVTEMRGRFHFCSGTSGGLAIKGTLARHSFRRSRRRADTTFTTQAAMKSDDAKPNVMPNRIAGFSNIGPYIVSLARPFNALVPEVFRDRPAGSPFPSAPGRPLVYLVGHVDELASQTLLAATLWPAGYTPQFPGRLLHGGISHSKNFHAQETPPSAPDYRVHVRRSCPPRPNRRHVSRPGFPQISGRLH